MFEPGPKPVLGQEFWEAETESALSSGVKGRLRSRAHYWTHFLQATKPILSIVEQGYVLLFMTVPMSRRFKNQKSALENADFVSKALSAMLSDGRVKEVYNPPTVCSPLLGDR